jgi:ribosome maturation factor RimP
MVDLKSKLRQWSEDFLAGSDEFLVDVENRTGSTVYRIYIDGMVGISVLRCAELSRHLSKLIDEDTSLEDADYFTMEVSSPGADKPLKLIKQYHKHIGRQLEVETTAGEVFEGTLEAVEGETINVLTKISKKETLLKQVNFNDIKEAKVIISFKETKK